MSIFVFFRWVPRSEIAGSILKFCRNLHTVFCRSCSTFPQRTRVPFPPYPPQRSLFVLCLVTAFLTLSLKKNVPATPPQRSLRDNKQLLTQADLSPQKQLLRYISHSSDKETEAQSWNQKALVSGLSNPKPDSHLTTEKDPAGYNAQNPSPLRGLWDHSIISPKNDTCLRPRSTCSQLSLKPLRSSPKLPFNHQIWVLPSVPFWPDPRDVKDCHSPWA